MDWSLLQKTAIALDRKSAAMHDHQCAAQQVCTVLNTHLLCPTTEWDQGRQSHMLREVQGFQVPAFCQIRQHPGCVGSQLQLRGCHNSLRRLGFCRPGSLRGSCRAVSRCCLQASYTFICLLEHGMSFIFLHVNGLHLQEQRITTKAKCLYSLCQMKCVSLTQLL